MAQSTENFIQDLIKTKAETFGSNSGITSVPKVVEINSKVENVIKSLDGINQDKPSGSDREGGKDENNKLSVSYGTCRVCGKPLEKPSKDGTCSLACQSKRTIENITTNIKSAQDKYEDVNAKVNNATQAVTALTQSLQKMVSLLNEVKSLGLDPKYENYFTWRINTVIQYLKFQIEKALILKNEKKLDQLLKAKNGIETDAADLDVLKNAQKAVAAAEKLLSKFQDLFDKIYKMVCSIKPLVLNPQSLNFQMTPRSMLKHPGQLVNQLPNNNINNSSCSSLLLDKIEKIISATFLPIQEAEYLMPPTAFKARLLVSNRNAKMINDLVQVLMMVMKGPTEPLPEYKNLSPINIQYLLFLLMSWGPEGLNHYAMPLYPP